MQLNYRFKIMKNRSLPSWLVLVYIFCFGLCTVNSYTQNPFYFEFTGPDTIFTDQNCNATLNWGFPANPIVECQSNLCVITNININISNGYQIGDTIPLGTTVTVNYLAVDNQGNNLDTFFTIFFGDNTPPYFDSIYLPEPFLSFNCIDDVPPLLSPDSLTAHDNCVAPQDSNLTVIITLDTFTTVTDSCSGGIIKRVWTATDPYGNKNSFTQSIEILPDTIAPHFTVLPVSDTVNCENQSYASWLQIQRNSVSAVDKECGKVHIFDNAPDSLAFVCGTLPVTFYAFDNCGNIDSVYAYYTINDSSPPSINPPTDSFFLLPCSLPANSIDSIIFSKLNNLSASDNCGMVNWSYTTPVFLDGCSNQTGTAQVWYIAADECGNKDSISSYFELIDTSAPFFISPPQNLTIQCDTSDIGNKMQEWLELFGNAVVGDNCAHENDLLKNIFFENGFPVSVSSLTDSLLTQGVCSPSQTLLFEIADSCGNKTSTLATVKLIDTIAPLIISSSINLIINCQLAQNADSSILHWLSNSGNALFQENCGSLALKNNFQTLTPGCGNTAFAEVVFTATDLCDNHTTDTALIKIIDTIAPHPTILPENITVSCEKADTALINWLTNKGGAVIADNCDTAKWLGFSYFFNGVQSDTVSLGDTPHYPLIPDSACSWSIDVTFFFADDCGNTGQVNASFSSFDLSAPSFSPIMDTLFTDCDNIPAPLNPEFTDNCDPNPVIYFSEKLFPGNCPGNYSLLRTWQAIDYCGNNDSISQWVIVQDSMAPHLSGVPADITAACNNIPLPPEIGLILTASDNCDPNPAINFSSTNNQHPDPDSCLHYNYLIERKWTVEDYCGNQSTFIQDISVVDMIPPTFSIPADLTITCDNVQDPGFTGIPANLADNCNSPVSINFSDDIQAGVCPQNYHILRTWVGTDVCGNSFAETQTISVIDEIAPQMPVGATDLTLSCIPDNELEALFTEWINQQGGAFAIDNCSAVNWFAAVPGTYDPLNPATFPGTSVENLNDPACLNPTLGIYRQEAVSFIAFDECLNTTITNATFTVVDNSPPVIEACPPDLTINTGKNSCDTLLKLPFPQFSDNCNAEILHIAPPMAGLSVTQAISSSVPGDFQTPVNPVTLHFGPVPTLPAYAASPALLTIDLILVDGEGPTEFFFIYGEDGTPLGITSPTDAQCGNSTTQLSITPQMINNWSADKYITITLEPNIPSGQSGAFAINDLCPAGPPTGGGGSIAGNLDYEAFLPSDLRLQYRINGNDTLPFPLQNPPQITLETGEHEISYFLTDCAGNKTNCSFNLSVKDQRPPVLLCPNDITISITEDLNCSDGIPFTLPYPTSLTDNCSFGQTTTLLQPADSAESYLTFSYDPNYIDYIADNKSFSFTNLPSNTAGQGVLLKIITEGDLDNPGEFFRIYGEDNTLLGTNEIGQPNVQVQVGFCSPSTTPSINVATFLIPTPLFNSWATDGDITIFLESNKLFNQPPPGIFGDGISPFCTSFPMGTPDGKTDSLSRVFLELSFEQTDIGYFSSGATQIGPGFFPETGSPPQHTFSQGSTTVFYAVSDQSGNKDTCSFEILVLDTLSPTAVCQPVTIFVNPSGVDDYILTPEEIDAGSSDNCGIAEMTLSQTEINCQQAGSTLQISLTVTDNSGNSSTCQSLVQVQTLAPQPSFLGGDCENDSLLFFANPPPTSAPNNNFYTYKWSAPPTGLTFSNQKNPVIFPAQPSNSGAFTLTITGVTGCEASATLNVLVEPQPEAPILQGDIKLCVGENTSLNCQSYTGASVTYYWYLTNSLNLQLIDSTNSPTITSPSFSIPGIYQIQAQVKVDGCFSNISTPFFIEVFEIPIASTANAPVIEECAGANVQLSAANIQPGINYFWTGPNGFVFDGSIPPALIDIDTFQSGTYFLTASNNGCTSDPTETILLINPKPPKPQIFGKETVCEGGSLSLNATPANADSYTWISPFLNTAITSEPSLIIAQADSTHDGSWTVFSLLNGCPSEAAIGFPLSVEPTPQVIAAYNSPACENVPLQLSANFFPDADYQWTGPQNYIGFNQNPSAPPISGVYNVKVISAAGCTGQATVAVNISEAPEITAISNTGGTNCVNGTTDIQLLSTVFPPNDGTYQFVWTGPNNFSSTNQIAIIPNAEGSDSGPYNLLVINGEGCSSTIKTTTVSLVDIPPTPQVIPSGQQVLCEGESITFSALGTYNNQATYIWNTPLGNLTTTSSSYSINGLTPLNSNEYSVAVIQNGCTSQASNIVNLTVHPKPQPPVFQANPNPVCVGDSLQFLTDFIPGANYQWSGPAGFAEQVYNPVISPVSPIHAGNYALQITVNGCSSDFSPFSSIAVSPNPTAPIISSNSPICISEPNAEILLYTLNGISGNQHTYHWYSLPSNALIGGPLTTDSLLITNLAPYPEGLHSFYATVTNQFGCTSSLSVPTVVQIDKPLNILAFAGEDIALCKDQSTPLHAENPNPAIGVWQQLSGPPVNITNPQNPETVISDLEPNQQYTLKWSISNGACTDFNSDTVSIFVYEDIQPALIGENISLCDSSLVLIEAVAPQSSNIGTWSQPVNQAAAGVIITAPDSHVTNIINLLPGQYTFTWTLSNDGCGAFSSDQILVQIGSSTGDDPSVGPNLLVCGDNQVNLQAQPLLYNTGMWSTPNSNIEIFFPNKPETVAAGLYPGENIFVWSIQNQSCGQTGTDTLIVTFDPGPISIEDTVFTSFNQPIDILPLLNDSISFSGFEFSILSDTENGTLQEVNVSELLYVPNIPFTGTDLFTYEICSQLCPDLCSESLVRIVVENSPDCIIPSIFTPNGDGVNDVFIIPCLAGNQFPSNSLTIFNEWGDQVFRASPYLNNWSGLYNGSPLAIGTYYYVIEYGGLRPSHSGFLILER